MLKKEQQRLRQRISNLLNSSYKRSLSDTSLGSWLSTDSSSSRGCMVVRTLNESLNGRRVVESRKRRRIKNIKLSMKIHRISNSPVTAMPDYVTKVKFSSVKIREYPMIPGDNPSVSNGPPLTMDWTASKTFSVAIDRFEDFCKENRQCSLQMAMPAQLRTALLLQAGYTPEVISLATIDADSIRQQRLQTNTSLSLDAAEERIESKEDRYRRHNKNKLRRK